MVSDYTTPRVVGSVVKEGDTKQAALPVVGSRWRSMLIGQPPIRNVSYSVSCSVEYGQNAHCVVYGPPPYSVQGLTIESETGVTVGDVYDEAERRFEAHEGCPRGRLNMFFQDHDALQRSWDDQSA